MRWSPAIAVAVLAALVAAGHVAAADGAREEATPRAQRAGCDRAVGTFGRREVFIGTVGAVRAVLNYADPDGLEPFRNPDGPGYGFKAPLAVRRGKVVTIAIARPDRDWVGISIDGRRPADRWLFTACPARRRARWIRTSGTGPRGPAASPSSGSAAFTSWPASGASGASTGRRCRSACATPATDFARRPQRHSGRPMTEAASRGRRRGGDHQARLRRHALAVHRPLPPSALRFSAGAGASRD